VTMRRGIGVSSPVLFILFLYVWLGECEKFDKEMVFLHVKKQPAKAGKPHVQLEMQSQAHSSKRQIGAFLGQKLLGRLTRGRLPPQPRPYGIGSPQVNGVAERLRPADQTCVICQYIIQRLHTEMIMNDIGIHAHDDDPYRELREKWASTEALKMAFTPPPPGAGSGSGSGSGGGSESGGSASASEGSFLEVDTTAEQSEPTFVEARATASARATSKVAMTAAVQAHRQDVHQMQSERQRFRQQLEQHGIFGAIKSGVNRLWNGATSLLTGSPSSDSWVITRTPPSFGEDSRYQDPPPAIPRFHPHAPNPPPRRSKKAWKTMRERFDDFWVWHPTQTRYSDLYELARKAEQRARERFEEQLIFKSVWGVMETLCVKHMPRPFYNTCGRIMRQYRLIAHGLMRKENAADLCMTTNFCSFSSYVQTGAHGRDSSG
jgi:hypothetical protein